MLEAVELPTGVANLDSGLADVDAEALSHDDDDDVGGEVSACNVQ